MAELHGLNGNNLGVDDGCGEATEDDISSLETHHAVHGPDVAKYHSARPWKLAKREIDKEMEFE